MSLDLQLQQITVDGRTISLSPILYELLEFLVLYRNETIPTLEIIERLWPGKEDEAFAYLHTCIRRQRKIIEPQ